MRKASLIRAIALGSVAAGVAAPLLRRRVKLPPLVTLATAAAAPVGLSVAFPRSRKRDIGVCALQMWAYMAAYEIPNDDHEALEARVHIDYPLRVDRVLGFGSTPTHRLQGLFAHPGEIQGYEKVFVWAHWVWFLVPHSTALYVLLRRREQFAEAAVLTYAVFDLGAAVYWLLPTAPPWYAAEQGRFDDGHTPRVRRMMIEYGSQFWKHRWGPLYSSLAGNPLAAMPSLHFATSVMAARILGRTGRLPGAIGWTYAGTLGLSLVYLGEHYVIDLLAGAALAEGVVLASGPLKSTAVSLAAGLERLQRLGAGA
ncbi:MAG: phosphatase PAP2 family protein [Solirubrobacterales bacterium]|nr:phosphatase PAP2 family protein [Solirubrobacterales bacterium]